MKRFTRRTVGAIVGLCLGWMAAGLAFPTGSLSLAADPSHGHGVKDPGQEAAAKLVPHNAAGEPASPEWFGTVVKLIAGLFVAAIIIGIPALKAKGGDPAGLASADDQAHAHHDDHGDADLHGHGHGHDTHSAGSHAH
jgi:hypothetical protein